MARLDVVRAVFARLSSSSRSTGRGVAHRVHYELSYRYRAQIRFHRTISEASKIVASDDQAEFDVWRPAALNVFHDFFDRDAPLYTAFRKVTKVRRRTRQAWKEYCTRGINLLGKTIDQIHEGAKINQYPLRDHPLDHSWVRMLLWGGPPSFGVGAFLVVSLIGIVGVGGGEPPPPPTPTPFHTETASPTPTVSPTSAAATESPTPSPPPVTLDVPENGDDVFSGQTKVEGDFRNIGDDNWLYLGFSRAKNGDNRIWPQGPLKHTTAGDFHWSIRIGLAGDTRVPYDLYILVVNEGTHRDWKLQQETNKEEKGQDWIPPFEFGTEENQGVEILVAITVFVTAPASSIVALETIYSPQPTPTPEPTRAAQPGP